MKKDKDIIDTLCAATPESRCEQRLIKLAQLTRKTIKYKKMITVTLTIDQIQAISLANQRAFIETGKYYLTKTESEEQFGRPLIELLLTNRLLKDSRPIKEKRHKCRFLLSDIITAIEIFKSI